MVPCCRCGLARSSIAKNGWLLRSPRVAVAPDDPSAGRPNVEVVPDLPGYLRRTLVDGHLGAVLDGLHGLVRVGRRTLLGSLASAVAFGALLLMGGIAQLIGAFWTRDWSGFFLSLLMGVLYLVLGVLFLRDPGDALLAMTLLLACALKHMRERLPLDELHRDQQMIRLDPLASRTERPDWRAMTPKVTPTTTLVSSTGQPSVIAARAGRVAIT